VEARAQMRPSHMDRRWQGSAQGHAGAESDHIVVPFVSDTLGSMTGESAVTLCLFACCQTGQETEVFLVDWGDGAWANNGNSALVEASKRALRQWDARLTLAVWRATAARATGPGVSVAKNWSPAGTGLAISRRRGCSRLRLRSTTTGSA
jgi:hypothetical protein